LKNRMGCLYHALSERNRAEHYRSQGMPSALDVAIMQNQQ